MTKHKGRDFDNNSFNYYQYTMEQSALRTWVWCSYGLILNKIATSHLILLTVFSNQIVWILYSRGQWPAMRQWRNAEPVILYGLNQWLSKSTTSCGVTMPQCVIGNALYDGKIAELFAKVCRYICLSIPTHWVNIKWQVLHMLSVRKLAVQWTALCSTVKWKLTVDRWLRRNTNEYRWIFHKTV